MNALVASILQFLAVLGVLLLSARSQGRRKRRDGAGERATRASGLDGRMADAASERTGYSGASEPGSDGQNLGVFRANGEAGSLEHASRTRGRRNAATILGPQAQGSSERSQPRRVASSPTRGFWSNADWIPCLDGVARPVEPGTFPLAHRSAARVGRLRAYGNAIVPQVAAVFIRAVMETMTPAPEPPP